MNDKKMTREEYIKQFHEKNKGRTLLTGKEYSRGPVVLSRWLLSRNILRRDCLIK